MSGFGRFFFKLLIIIALFFGLLAIYGIFSFSYGFVQPGPPNNDWEVLAFNHIIMWPNLFSEGDYFFVAVSDTGKAYFGSGTTEEIGTMTGLLYALRDSSYSVKTYAWWIVFPILMLVTLFLPLPHAAEPASAAPEETKPVAPAPIPAPTPAPVPAAEPVVKEEKKPLTADEKEARRRKRGLVWSIVASVVATAVVVSIIVVNVKKENNVEQAGSGNSLAPVGRKPFVVGSASSPVTSASTASNALENHQVADVYYSFTSASDYALEIPSTIVDVVFYNIGTSSSRLILNIPDERTTALTLGLVDVQNTGYRFISSKCTCSINLKFSGSNSLTFPYDLDSSAYPTYVVDLPNVPLTLTPASSGANFTLTTKGGRRGSDGTNGQNPTTDESACNGTNGTAGSSTAGGFRTKSLVLTSTSISYNFTVETGDAGAGGNGGKHGWYFGVLGIGSHDGKDGRPGSGGKAGAAIATTTGYLTYLNQTQPISATGALMIGNYTFSNGANGAAGGING
jgi:hypothetical protein